MLIWILFSVVLGAILTAMGFPAWSLFVIGGLIFTLLVLGFSPWANRDGAVWGHLDVLDGLPNKDDLIRLFFLPDRINALFFRTNYIDVQGWPQSCADLAAIKPTPSMAAFVHGANAPLIYPRWFLAAYPDVVMWAATGDENNMARLFAEALYGATKAKELLRNHEPREVVALIDRVRAVDLQQLRRLVDMYRRHTGKQLECSA